MRSEAGKDYKRLKMYEIIKKETLVPNIIYMRFKAPKIACTAKPGRS